MWTLPRMWSTKGQPAPPRASRCAASSAGVKMFRNSVRTMASRAARSRAVAAGSTVCMAEGASEEVGKSRGGREGVSKLARP